ncbi:MAG: HdeD family acid-resistance protein [Eggerthellaceae bacterium]|jgi:uncharacterized membrane protein HdeD (DUF308 family)
MAEYEERFAAWPLLISGIVLVIVALVCFFSPGLAFGVAGVLIGVGFIVTGASCLMMRFTADGLFPTASLSMWTVFSLVLGILFVANPVTSTVVLVWLMFFALLIFGVFNLALGIRERGHDQELMGTNRIILSVVAIVLAIIIMALPNMLVYMIALFALIAGIYLVYTALKAPRQLVR